MDTNVDERYENLRKSVNNAIKLFCNKIENLKSEVKELKTEKAKNEKTSYELCNCAETNKDMKNTVEILEEKMEAIITGSNQTRLDNEIKDNIARNKNKVEKIESEIEELNNKQKENYEKILVISDNIVSLQQSLDAFEKSEENKRVLKGNQDNVILLTEVNGKSNTRETENINAHMKSKNQKHFPCDDCEQSFPNRFSLEEHLIKVHNMEKSFKCNVCEIKFLKKWRLAKHMELHQHQASRIKTCHFFNNKKHCPYFSSGCKFLHIEAQMCSSSKNCTYKMCQFRH